MKTFNQDSYLLYFRKKLTTHDTVGAVALDKNGKMAIATSTGGIAAKCLGRVGDSPLIGKIWCS